MSLTVLNVCGAFEASDLDRPQVFWQGKLEGTHDLIVHRSSISVVDVSGPPVTDQVYRFTRPLPDDSLVTDVDPRTSRGYVRVLEQPAMGNDYTLQIRIEDRQTGPFLYGIAVRWNENAAIMSTSDLRRPRKLVLPKDPAWNVDGHPAKITCHAFWQGEIHGSARLAIANREARVVAGKARGGLNVWGNAAWPKAAYHPVVLATSKETHVLIVSAPAADNGYTLTLDVSGDTGQAVVEIAW